MAKKYRPLVELQNLDKTTTMTKTPEIILASTSPRRKQLLEQIDLSFEIIPSSVHEDFSISLEPEQFAMHYAQAKAENVALQHPGSLVIGADTIVVFDGKILGKPKDENDSFNMLSMLSGQTHKVVTGVSIQWKNNNINDTFFETTYVTFTRFDSNAINCYIETYHPFDKAGSYGIQDSFSVYVKKIEGDFYNVMGFPLSAFFKRFSDIIH
jgi:septum formation protein